MQCKSYVIHQINETGKNVTFHREMYINNYR